MPPTVNSGELLRSLIHLQAASTTTITTPVGWTELWDSDDAAAPFRGASYAKVASGIEGGTTVDFVSSTATTAAAQVHRVTGWFGSLLGVEVATPNQVNASPTVGAPSLGVSWGADDNLWFAEGGCRDDDETVTSYPDDYIGGAATVSGGGFNNGCSVFSAFRQFNDNFQTPGVFFLTGSEAWICNTMGVRPGSGGAAADVLPQGLQALAAGNVALSRAMHSIESGYIA